LERDLRTASGDERQVYAAGYRMIHQQSYVAADGERRYNAIWTPGMTAARSSGV
jgi:hypothetical protein